MHVLLQLEEQWGGGGAVLFSSLPLKAGGLVFHSDGPVAGGVAVAMRVREFEAFEGTLNGWVVFVWLLCSNINSVSTE